ncbi:MAG: tail fiber protein [Gallionellaceae bacterium]
MESFLGEIKLWAVARVPQDWALCNGAILSINENGALFALIGTYFGGNGVNNFALPDLRGRAIVYPTYGVGEISGRENVGLGHASVPNHTHAVNVCSTAANKSLGLDNHMAVANNDNTPVTDVNLYAPSDNSDTALSPNSVSSSGANLSHNNMQPSLVLNYFICTNGLFPQRN